MIEEVEEEGGRQECSVRCCSSAAYALRVRSCVHAFVRSCAQRNLKHHKERSGMQHNNTGHNSILHPLN
jgi:hypothetical protein